MFTHLVAEKCLAEFVLGHNLVGNNRSAYFGQHTVSYGGPDTSIAANPAHAGPISIHYAAGQHATEQAYCAILLVRSASLTPSGHKQACHVQPLCDVVDPHPDAPASHRASPTYAELQCFSLPPTYPLLPVRQVKCC
jgi:hypothetical protein